MKKVGVTGAAGFVGSHLCRAPARRGLRGRRRSTTSRTARGNMRRLPASTAASRSRCSTARGSGRLRAAFDGCDAIMHLAAKKIPRFGGALRDAARSTSTACNAACSSRARRSTRDRDHTRRPTSTATATPPFREDGEMVIGPPTSKRWAYAVVEDVRRAHRAALAEERGPEGHDPAPVQRLRPPQPPHLVGRPARRDLHRGAPRRRGRWRSTATACRSRSVHVRERHGRRLHARAGDPGVASARSSTSADETRHDHATSRRRSRTAMSSRPLRAKFVGYE